MSDKNFLGVGTKSRNCFLIEIVYFANEYRRRINLSLRGESCERPPCGSGALTHGIRPLVPKDAADEVYEKWDYTESGFPSEVVATYTLGDAEIRYMNENGTKILFRTPIRIIAPVITLKVKPEAVTGEKVPIEWTGPGNKGDYITIVPKSTKNGNYEKYAYAEEPGTLEIKATETLGSAEIRYMNENGNRVLARIPINIVATE